MSDGPVGDERILHFTMDEDDKTWSAGRWLIEHDIDPHDSEAWWYWLSACDLDAELDSAGAVIYVRLNGYYHVNDAAAAAERLEFVLQD